MGMNEPTSADFYAAFGVADPSATLPVTPPVTPPADPNPPPVTPPADPVPPVTPPADSNTPPPADPPADPNKPTDPAVPPVDDKGKQNYAFAQMRTQLTKYEKMLKDIGGVLKIDASQLNDPEIMTKALSDAVVNAQAKAQGIDPVLLQKMTAITEENARYKEQEIKNLAFVGLAKLQKDFGIDQNAVNAFLTELDQAQINPFVTPIDLVAEYRDRHWQDIVNAKVAAAVREEQERAAKALTNSSQPPTSTGADTGDPGKITSVADLTAWFNKQQ